MAGWTVGGLIAAVGSYLYANAATVAAVALAGAATYSSVAAAQADRSGPVINMPPVESRIPDTPGADTAKGSSQAAQMEQKRQMSMIRARARTVFTEGEQQGLGSAATTSGKKQLLGQ
jgi:hypothetical protein